MENNTKAKEKIFIMNDSSALHSAMKTMSMGLVSLKALSNALTSESKLTRYLDDEVFAYKKFEDSIAAALKSIGEDEEKTGVIESGFVTMSVNMNTLADKSDSHIAEMMLQGLNMGVIEITKVRNKFNGTLSESCFDLLSEILNTLDLFAEDMKKFL